MHFHCLFSFHCLDARRQRALRSTPRPQIVVFWIDLKPIRLKGRAMAEQKNVVGVIKLSDLDQPFDFVTNAFGRTVRLCASPATALSQQRRIRLQL